MLALIRRRLKSGGERGFTLMEIIVVLGVIGIMAAVLTPMILNYLEDAKKSKAESDVKTIGSAILRLTRDVAHFPLFKDGTQTTGTPDWELLRGPGNNPVDHDSKKWLSTSKTGELEDHLVKNNPEGTASTASNSSRSGIGLAWLVSPAPAWATHNVGHQDQGAQGGSGGKKYATTGRFPWRGPYLEKVSEDPWGNRYLVNIKNANPADNPAKVVWALSAGPNGKIETDPNANADSGPAVGGDDIAVRIK